MHKTPIMLPSLAIVLFLVALPNYSWGGPWTPRPWHGYAKLWVKWHLGIEYQDGTGERRDYGAYHEVFWSFYGELGLVDSVALWLHAPLVRLFMLEDLRTGQLEKHVYPGEPTVGFRWRFLQRGPLALATEVGATIPVATKEPVQPVFADEPTTPQVGTLQVGTGELDLPLSLLVGYSWTSTYTAASLSYMVRTGGFAHVIAWSIEGGWHFTSRFTSRLRLSGRHPLPMGDAPRHESPSGIGNGTTYTAFAGELDYRLHGGWALGLVVEGGLLNVRRQSRGPVFSLAVSTVF